MMRPLILALAILSSGCLPVRSSGSASSFRVLVYNIHAGKDAARVDNLERVAAMIAESGADLVLLQEVDSATRRGNGIDQLAWLAARTGMHGIFGSTIEWQGGSFGLGMLSRYPITDSELVPLRTDPLQPRAGYTREPRGMLVASIAAPGGPLAIINTHLDASREGDWRRQEVAHLLAVTDSLVGSGMRVILGGDLNARPSSAELQPLSAAGLRDSWLVCGEGPGFTFPAAAPNRRIDYLFLPPGLVCRQARVLPQQASDHRALLVELVR